jgi:hypothetical protein
LKSNFLLCEKRSNWPGKKVVAFGGIEEAEGILRFSTCFKRLHLLNFSSFHRRRLFFVLKRDVETRCIIEFLKNIWVMAICIVVPSLSLISFWRDL